VLASFAAADDACEAQTDGLPKDLSAMRVRMPGKSFKGALPPLTDRQATWRDALRRDVLQLAGGIGERNLGKPQKYTMAAQFIEKSLTQAGHNVQLQQFTVRGQPCVNIAAELSGNRRADQIVVVGAHYDSAPGTAGANDNGSGVAGLLALARRFAKTKPDRTLRFVFFANEEPPYFQTDNMGSLVYARRCRAQKEDIVGMLSLETIGYYSDAKNSQHYPAPFNLFYPSTGNFVAFVGNVKSRALVETCVGSFRRHAEFPSEGGAIPGIVQGVGWSDHWSFWKAGYSALMVTDTAPFRYPHYHLPSDTPEKIDYDRLARVIDGLASVVEELISIENREPDTTKLKKR
jgi:Zn-dependent M28 family amino/carboxypeptidase